MVRLVSMIIFTKIEALLYTSGASINKKKLFTNNNILNSCLTNHSIPEKISWNVPFYSIENDNRFPILLMHLLSLHVYISYHAF